MADTLKMTQPGAEDTILDYPPERLYVHWGATAAIGFHLLFASIILILAYIHHIRNLRDLMTATITQVPIDQLQIMLIDDNKPPPPTNHPLWIKQIIVPKIPPPPPPPPKPKPKPKPQPIRLVPRLVVGSHNLPTPDYPSDAWDQRIQGTVLLQVSFDGSGGVFDVQVINSSGSSILDSSARHYILENWRDVDFAGQVETVPIQYMIPP